MLVMASASSKEMAIQIREAKIQGLIEQGYTVTIKKQWEEQNGDLWYAYASVSF